MKIKELRSHFHKGKANAYAWPGGYPLFYLCSDGGVLCPECMTKERKQVFRSTHEESNDGWHIVAVDATLEDPNLYCDHCGKRIESAYVEPEESKVSA